MTAAADRLALPGRAEPRVRLLAAAGRFFRRKPLGAVGALLLVLVLAMALVPSVISRFPPGEFHARDRNKAPNSTYIMGTDHRGRDIFSRVVYGARTSLQVGALTVLIGTTLGLVVGLVSGFAGGKLDFTLQRVVDSFQAFPALFLALALTTALGRDITNIGIAVAIVTWPSASRVVRSAVLSQKQATYIEAARATGAGVPRILLRHLLPNVASIYIILATAALAQAILVESSLSFLGVGVNLDQVSWGVMLLEAQTNIREYPWAAIFPGIAISVAVFGFNLFGDALRDVLDPRLRGR